LKSIGTEYGQQNVASSQGMSKTSNLLQASKDLSDIRVFINKDYEVSQNAVIKSVFANNEHVTIIG